MSIFDLEECKAAKLILHIDQETKEHSYTVTDPGLYYGVPMFEQGRRYTGIEFSVIKQRLMKNEPLHMVHKWIQVTTEKQTGPRRRKNAWPGIKRG